MKILFAIVAIVYIIAWYFVYKEYKGNRNPYERDFSAIEKYKGKIENAETQEMKDKLINEMIYKSNMKRKC